MLPVRTPGRARKRADAFAYADSLAITDGELCRPAVEQELASRQRTIASYTRVVTDMRRIYYDHEPAYRKIKAHGGRGRCYPRAPRRRVRRRGGTRDRLRRWPGLARAARHGFRTTGVDFAETVIELARLNADEAALDVEFVVGDALALPFPDGSFELVVDNHVLHCIVEPADRDACSPRCAGCSSRAAILVGDDVRRRQLRSSTLRHRSGDVRFGNRTRIWVRRAQLEAGVDDGRLRGRQHG